MREFDAFYVISPAYQRPVHHAVDNCPFELLDQPGATRVRSCELGVANACREPHNRQVQSPCLHLPLPVYDTFVEYVQSVGQVELASHLSCCLLLNCHGVLPGWGIVSELCCHAAVLCLR